MTTVAAGEADMSMGDIVRKAAAMFGGAEWVNCYVLTNYKESEIDPVTGAKVHPRRFCVGRFLTQADAKKIEPARRQEVLGSGASWAEAFARAEIALRGGAA